ncbi:hypothetical protein MGWOODY_XGa1959 [hydrothermal vent metagenome]|uniref:Uncharacterized protein n=1 Tax=hydrothermal vent metagenome TaxID=652676 RepID=A0A160TYN1_9ZZZZ
MRYSAFKRVLSQDRISANEFTFAPFNVIFKFFQDSWV